MQKRAAFTLVELLVVILLLLLVVTMTIGAVSFTLEDERIRTGARQVQSFLEGARSRATQAKRPRGVRFLLDPARDAHNQRQTVSSMIYIGPAETWSEGELVVLWDDYYDNMTASPGPDGIPDTPAIPATVQGLRTGWYELARRGLIVSGRTRMRIPKGPDGTWYIVYLHDALGPGPDQQVLRLAIPYRSPNTNPTTNRVAVSPSPTYELELPWAPLPNQEPMVLPGGVVIDLLWSDVPGGWQLGTQSVAGVTWPVWGEEMELHFSPRGTVIGPAAAKGVVHLCLTKREESEALLRQRSAATGLPSIDLSSAEQPSEMLLTSVFTQTGMIVSSRMNLEDNPAGPDGEIDRVNDDVYRFPETGAGN